MQTPPEAKTRLSPIIWYGISGLVAILALWFWFTQLRSASAIDLPYSAFLEQVKDSNVRGVIITGSQVEGTLVRPVTGPIPITGRNRPNLAFHTNLPNAVIDANLVSLLYSHHVVMTSGAAHASFLAALEQSGPAVPLLGLALLAAIAGIITHRGGLLEGLKRLNPFQHKPPFPYTVEYPTETYASIAGQNEIIENLKSVTFSGTFPSILLIAGQPGTGKTLLARAVAGERHAALFTCKAAHLLSPAVTPRDLHNFFEMARNTQPGILLIQGLHETVRDNPAAFHQLVSELDGIEADQNLIVLGETQYPADIDPALLRSGRFDRSIVLDVPDRQAREDILSLHTRKLHLANNINLGVIARTTTGFTGAELAGLCLSAAHTGQQNGHDPLMMADFEDALDRLLVQSPHSLLLNEQERRAVAYHEAGHALVAWLLAIAFPANRISILPRNGSFHNIQQLLREEEQSATSMSVGKPGKSDNSWPGYGFHSANLYNKEDLLAYLSLMLGGRAAEEIAIGDVTISAENDLVEATRLARRMVTRWGMGSMGLMAFDQPNPTRACAGENEISEETAARIDQDVQSLLTNRYTAVCKLLEEAREPLDQLVKALLVDETLDLEDISQLLGPRSFELSDGTNALFTAP